MFVFRIWIVSFADTKMLKCNRGGKLIRSRRRSARRKWDLPDERIFEAGWPSAPRGLGGDRPQGDYEGVWGGGGFVLGAPPGRKIRRPREVFRGGNFFVRANDVSGFFGEHGGNHLDGFHFHFSRVLPLASSRFFRIWIRIC